MRVLGIDLAASKKTTFACVLEEGSEDLRVKLHARCDDATLLGLADGAEKVAIDAPFGWPRAFIDALAAHRRFEAWPAPDDDRPELFRAELSFRATDRVTMQTRRPLSVSTDKLGVTAMRCAHLLHRWHVAGETIDRTGAGRFVEVYPAGALVRWALDPSGYKGSDTKPLAKLVAGICAAVPGLGLSDADRHTCEQVDHAFDALVCALVARAALVGLTDPPPPVLRGQAVEEGWIHLPLWGSLPGAGAIVGSDDAAARPAPGPAAAAALAAHLEQSGVVLDAKGYAERFDEVVLPSFSQATKAAIRRDLSGKGGSELVARAGAAAKFHAAHSSACLAANVFGPWLDEREGVPFGDGTFAGTTGLERECATGLRGTPPTLDWLVEGPRVLAVESKCTEHLSAHEASFSPAYEARVGELAHMTWRREYERLVADPRRYRHLDAAQLVKHYLGVKREFSGRPVTLAYLYWEPLNADEITVCSIHAAEVNEFASKVGDPQVVFVALTHRQLWDEWAADGQPTWLREHAAALRRRYDVTI
ncbi:DUF429 domain-containing protein [Conexibacter sp. CPCC 206217]|uniref:DUF429 domain-containing protein n=1 Tax=Conexibacter sp. CPCC 206217 TaxID=3064574 RepID=UPI002724CB29|nr:DUF429 domain-containing protein [Conexibacter sp. CPCC 206217]MDO8212930.1 DUF429 domain-containing protein [Conexibacter sp. CPCC 206217]